MLVNNGWNESSKSAKKVSEDIEKAAKELKENVELVEGVDWTNNSDATPSWE